METVDDLACLYATPREICYHLDEHSLEDKHIDSAVRSWTVAKRWVSSWKRYSLRRRKRKVLSPRPVPDNKVFKNDRFGKICTKKLSVFSNSQIPTQATTTTGEPAFHSSSPVILQQLVQVIRKMGQHSRFSVEVSDSSELTLQLLQRRFQRFSDGWRRRIMNALRNWQIWASKHRPPLPFWSPSANQLGEYLISVDKRGPTVARSVWTQLDWVRRELGAAFPTDSLLLASFKLYAVGHLPTPAVEMPPGVFLAITNLSSTTQGAVAIFGGIVMLLAIGCLRWRHQARSIVEHFDEQFITGKCLLGKSKVQGQRQAFAWRVPKKVSLCFSILDRVFVLLSTLYIKNPDLCSLVPDFESDTLPPSSNWLPKPMSHVKFMRTFLSDVSLDSSASQRRRHKTSSTITSVASFQPLVRFCVWIPHSRSAIGSRLLTEEIVGKPVPVIPHPDIMLVIN